LAGRIVDLVLAAAFARRLDGNVRQIRARLAGRFLQASRIPRRFQLGAAHVDTSVTLVRQAARLPIAPQSEQSKLNTSNCMFRGTAFALAHSFALAH
jgi:virulence-associated protein VagC